jgi:hypothetical protein
MEDLLQKLTMRTRKPIWEPLRGQLLEICQKLLDVSPDPKSEIVSYYVKFSVDTTPMSPTFAAVWFKNSKRLIVGLALPEGYEAAGLGTALPGTFYKGLTKYFTVERGGDVPQNLGAWIELAYQNGLASEGISSGSITTWEP